VRDFSAAELLDVREVGAHLPRIERALVLLAAAHGLSQTEVARWSIGARDARLLELRERTFGPVLEILAECPHCAKTAEASIRIADLLALDEQAVRADSPAEREWSHGDVHVRFRPITSEDLLAVLHAGESETALLERSIIAGGDSRAIDGESFAAALAAADPLADITLAMLCPECATEWSAQLDVVSCVWAELDAWADRAIDDVHRLARAYGWSESQILALSPARRTAYLERIAQ
jgi:hypothetical protein